MSRVGKKGVLVPNGVSVEIDNVKIKVKGKNGELSLILHSAINLSFLDNIIHVMLVEDDRKGRAIQGLTRSLIANMIVGVSIGFEKSLEINGIGYKVELKDGYLIFNLGYSHLVRFKVPDVIQVTVNRSIIKLFSIDKEKLGHVAASIRQLRPPEPYKGKGIKYVGEYIQRKAGKAGTK